jgi:LPXTG-site transpeptidase (sortase) family protein
MQKHRSSSRFIHHLIAVPVLLAVILSPAAPAAAAPALSSAPPQAFPADLPAGTNTVPLLGVVQQWSLTAPRPAALDEFGYAVAIDGDTAVIGARNADPDLGNGPLNNAGAAYVYVRSGQTWVLEAELTANNAAPGDTFGVAVAISGNTLAVGATGVDMPDPQNDDEVLNDVGAVYIFTRRNGVWTQQAKLQPSDWAEDDAFGSAVALSRGTLVAAADTKDLSVLVDLGAVYVFYNSGGSNWKQQAKLVPADPLPRDYFGSSVAIEGNLIAVGAIQSYFTGPGKTYLYRNTAGVWKQEDRLEAEGGELGDAFGSAVALSGGTLIVGAYSADPEIGGERVISAGAAYIFTKSGHSWKQSAVLTAPDGLSFDQFGQAVDIDGSTVVVGALGATQAGETGAGAVYIFKKISGKWSFQTRAVTDPAGEDDLFGKSLAIDGDWFVAGASGRDPDSLAQAGEAFMDLLGGVQLPAAGFAPGVQTRLPAQPRLLAYQDYGVMSLEIPSLGVQIPIAGVPKSGAGWDVRWLGGQAGYLEGTAFPTWAGNSGLAGHATLADGTPGPFAGLGSLKWDDQVIIHAWGQRYIYAVRENSLVLPNQVRSLRHEELPWVTLITCQGYDELGGGYRWRRIVRAVLVAVL